MRGLQRWHVFLFIFGLTGGLLGEAVLVMREHCARLESSLYKDFRLIAFLGVDVSESRRRVAQEKLLALPGTEELRFVPPEASLAELEARDEEFAESVAFLGSNPLPGALEVRLARGQLANLDAWLDDAGRISEVGDIRFKPLQHRAILQAGLYARFLTVLLCLALFGWAFGTGGLLLYAWRTGLGLEGVFGPLDELGARMGLAGAGTAFGAAAARLLAGPTVGDALAGAWPAPWCQFLLVGVGACAGAALLGVSAGLSHAGRGRQTPARAVHRLLAVAAGLALLAAETPAFASPLKQKREELQGVRRELQLKREEYQRILDREKELRSDLRELQRERESSRRALAQVEGQRRSADSQRLGLGERLGALADARAGGESALAGELRAYLRFSTESAEEFGSGDLWEEALRQAAFRQKRDYLASLGFVHSGTAVRHEVLAREGLLLGQRTRSIAHALELREDRLRRVSRDFDSLRQKARLSQDELRELESSAVALAGLVRDLQKARPKSATLFEAEPAIAKHSLGWPARGKLLTRYGKSRVPELGTWVIRNGIEIAAERGTAVAAAAPGKVIFAGPFRSYGNVVILDHGRGLYSIYGNLGAIERAHGEQVAGGGGIGTVGEAAEGRSGSLYFELRQGSKALDPSAWLRRPQGDGS